MNRLVRWSRRHWWAIALVTVCVVALAWWLTLTVNAIQERNAERAQTTEVAHGVAYQTLVIERDLTALRIRAEQTADCPVLYLRDLLAELGRGRDLGSVPFPSHCQAQGLAELEERARSVEAAIARADAERSADG